MAGGYDGKSVNEIYQNYPVSEGDFESLQDQLKGIVIDGDMIVEGSIEARHIKTGSLVVGDNVEMGPNAYISWGNVTNQPSIPDGTYIDANGVYTGTVSADQIFGGTITGVTLKSNGADGSDVEISDGKMFFKTDGKNEIGIGNYQMYFYDWDGTGNPVGALQTWGYRESKNATGIGLYGYQENVRMGKATVNADNSQSEETWIKLDFTTNLLEIYKHMDMNQWDINNADQITADIFQLSDSYVKIFRDYLDNTNAMILYSSDTDNYGDFRFRGYNETNNNYREVLRIAGDEPMMKIDTYADGRHTLIFDRTGTSSLGNDIALHPDTDMWGFLGTETKRFFEMHSGSFLNTSSKETKENIVELKEVTDKTDKMKKGVYEVAKNLKTYSYSRKEKNNFQLGILSEEAPKEILHRSGNSVDLNSYITFVFNFAQEIAKRLEKIES